MNPGVTSLKIEKLRVTLENALIEIKALDKANKDIIELSEYIWGENMNLIKYIRDAELIKYNNATAETSEDTENIDYYRSKALQKTADILYEKESTYQI